MATRLPSFAMVKCVLMADVLHAHILLSSTCANSTSLSISRIELSTQTGSGKTFTMQGADKTPGIVQRVAAMIEAELARAARDHDADSELQVFASYVELYMEQLRDLLVANPAADLEIKEDPMGGIYVKDLTQRRVQTAAEMIAVTTEGQQRRTVAATKMNAESSRSHSMLQLTLRHVGKGDASSSARLTLIDLAGSERAGDTGATGIVLQQATKINQSLSALGNVMSALCDGSKHIPFRDSKLTRLLQNSFQGRSKTLMIACLSPASSNASESISTLRFADRAKHIKTRALAVADPKQARIQDLEREVRRLRSVLRQCKCGLASQVNAPGGDAGGDALDLAGDDAASAVPAYCVCLGATCCESSSSCIVS